MKKQISLLLAVAVVALSSVPAFAASNKVTVSLDKMEEVIIPNTDYGTFSRQLLQTQIQYLTYCNDVLSGSSNSMQYDSKSQAQDTAKKKYEMGYISLKEYQDAMQTVTDQTDGQLQQSNQRAQDLLKLRHLIGLDDEDKLTVKPADYSNINLSKKLSNINYSKDLKDWADDFGSSQIETFKQLYDSMRLANQTYQSDLAKYETKKADAELVKQKFDRGYATQKQLDDINNELQTLSNTVAKDQNTVYSAYLQYDFMRDQGYSAASSLY